jgi:hypothetical protein
MNGQFPGTSIISGGVKLVLCAQTFIEEGKYITPQFRQTVIKLDKLITSLQNSFERNGHICSHIMLYSGLNINFIELFIADLWHYIIVVCCDVNSRVYIGNTAKFTARQPASKWNSELQWRRETNRQHYDTTRCTQHTRYYMYYILHNRTYSSVCVRSKKITIYQIDDEYH